MSGIFRILPAAEIWTGPDDGEGGRDGDRREDPGRSKVGVICCFFVVELGRHGL